MLDYELADVTFWVEIGGRKPFPITIYRKDGAWCFDAHTQSLTTEQEIMLKGFVRERTRDLDAIWGKHTKVHLNWQKTQRKKSR